MHVLLSNDDGVDAEGLHHLRDALLRARPDWRITVVAPDREQSATSHALTLTQPVRVEERGQNIFAVSGTPTDCILIALHELFVDDRPDIVLSGINHGPNMGEDVHYSGTVAAAFEGRILGLPAIALSLSSRELPLDFSTASHFCRTTLPVWVEDGVASGRLLNVNIPGGAPEEAKGIKVCRLGTRQYRDVVVPKQDPRGRTYYWIAGHQHTVSPEPDTDLVLSREGWITVTPLQVDLTAHDELKALRALDHEQR